MLNTLPSKNPQFIIPPIFSFLFFDAISQIFGVIIDLLIKKKLLLFIGIMFPICHIHKLVLLLTH